MKSRSAPIDYYKLRDLSGFRSTLAGLISCIEKSLGIKSAFPVTRQLASAVDAIDRIRRKKALAVSSELQ